MKTLAIMLPVYNEEATIYKVVTDLVALKLDADIFICDNNSTDRSFLYARQLSELYSNVYVFTETEKGKGNAIKKLWPIVKMYQYVGMIDADDTYDVKFFKFANELMRCKKVKPDMIVGNRFAGGYLREAKSITHRLCNLLIVHLTKFKTKKTIDDPLSGARMFSQSFMKSFTPQSTGFTLETELNLAAKTICNVPVVYRDRKKNSHSKINLLEDGYKILKFLFTGEE